MTDIVFLTLASPNIVTEERYKINCEFSLFTKFFVHIVLEPDANRPLNKNFPLTHTAMATF